MLTVGGTMAGPPLNVGRPDTVMSCACLAVLGSGLADGVAPAPVVPIVAKPPGPAAALLGLACAPGLVLAAAAGVPFAPSAEDSRQPGIEPVTAAAVIAPAVTALSATDASRRGRGTLTLQMS